MGSDKYEKTLEQVVNEYEAALNAVKVALAIAEEALGALKLKLKEIKPSQVEQTI